MKHYVNNKDFIIDNACLMTEWDWEENEKNNLDPRKLSLGSGKKAHWICSKGHKWTTSIYHRAIRKTNCPYCANKQVLIGYNDLQSQHPDLMAEWDYAENIIDPSTVTVKVSSSSNVRAVLLTLAVMVIPVGSAASVWRGSIIIRRTNSHLYIIYQIFTIWIYMEII